MTNLSKAFKQLRKAGYFARQNFMCCQSCGWSAIPEEKSNKVVFYHSQDKEDINKDRDFYLAWAGNGAEILEIFKNNGILCEWDGTEETRIKVLINTI